MSTLVETFLGLSELELLILFGGIYVAAVAWLVWLIQRPHTQDDETEKSSGRNKQQHPRDLDVHPSDQ